MVKIGYMVFGVPPLAAFDAVTTAAKTAERLGFHSIWASEHILLPEVYTPNCPYTADGRLPEEMEADYLDPFITLSFMAACTKSIRIGSGIALLALRNPLETAKIAASLDRLSGGRFDFGIGVGWLKEEFDALGVPWERRGARTSEYARVMKKLWTEQKTAFSGEFSSFPTVFSYPKPTQKPHPPLIFGGESDLALRRVAEIGDGWFGIGLSPEAAAEKIAFTKGHAAAVGRNPDALSFAVSPGMNNLGLTPDDIARFHDAGVDQLILGSYSRNLAEVLETLEQMAIKVVEPANLLHGR